MKTFEYSIYSDAAESVAVLAKGITQMPDLITYIQQLPYGRTADRTKPILVLQEQKGTCSSKHALIKTIATQNGDTDLQLIIGMYKMNRKNTPGIQDELEKHGLVYVPEAHCYLKRGEDRIDITNPQSNISQLEPDLLEELIIEPFQIGTFKVEYHQKFLKQWLAENPINFSFEDIWTIREDCIKRLSASI